MRKKMTVQPQANTSLSSNPSTFIPPKEMIVIIQGSWNSKGKSLKKEHLDAESKTGIHYSGDLQERYIEFSKTHEIIDVQSVHQSVGHEIVLVVRYKP